MAYMVKPTIPSFWWLFACCFGSLYHMLLQLQCLESQAILISIIHSVHLCTIDLHGSHHIKDMDIAAIFIILLAHGKFIWCVRGFPIDVCALCLRRLQILTYTHPYTRIGFLHIYDSKHHIRITQKKGSGSVLWTLTVLIVFTWISM